MTGVMILQDGRVLCCWIRRWDNLLCKCGQSNASRITLHEEKKFYSCKLGCQLLNIKLRNIWEWSKFPMPGFMILQDGRVLYCWIRRWVNLLSKCGHSNTSRITLQKKKEILVIQTTLPTFEHKITKHIWILNGSILTVDGPGSSVSIATAYGLGRPGIESRWGEIFRTCPDRPWGPPSLL